MPRKQLTEEVPAREVASRMLQKDQAPPCVTTEDRKKKIHILHIDTVKEPIISEWKHEWYVIPSYILGVTTCLDYDWIFEVQPKSAEDEKFVCRFREKESLVCGKWLESPSAALGDAYFNLKKVAMKASQNGRAEIGVFTKPMRAVIVSALKEILLRSPGLLEKLGGETWIRDQEKMKVRVHLDADQSLMKDTRRVQVHGQIEELPPNICGWLSTCEDSSGHSNISQNVHAVAAKTSKKKRSEDVESKSHQGEKRARMELSMDADSQDIETAHELLDDVLNYVLLEPVQKNPFTFSKTYPNTSPEGRSWSKLLTTDEVFEAFDERFPAVLVQLCDPSDESVLFSGTHGLGGKEVSE